MGRGIQRLRAAEKQTTLILDSRTKSALAADQNDYDLAVGSCFNLSTSGGARSLTGIAGGTEGRVIQLVNVGGDYIYLLNESASSLAQDRILTALPSGQTFNLAPNMSVFLSYNNVVNRWLVLHSSVVFDPEVDTPIATMLGGLRSFKRAAGLMTRSLGSLRVKFKALTTGDKGTQAFGVVAGAQVSFSMPAGGDVLVLVSGTSYTGIAQALYGLSLGARFDADAALVLQSANLNNGAGGDYVGDVPMMGFWGKSLAAGAHTADLCWGDAVGNYGLRANAAQPLVVAVLYPG